MNRTASRCPRPLALLPTVALFLIASASPSQHLAAQTPSYPINLVNAQTRGAVLTADGSTGSVTFTINGGDFVQIDIASTSGDLATEVEGPNGEQLVPANVESYGGTFVDIEGPSTPDSPLIASFSFPGFHYTYTFPSLGDGEYTVRVEAEDPIEPLPVLIQVVTNSPLGAAVFPTEPILVLGNPSVLTAVIFDGTTPVTEATVEATVLFEGETPTVLSLLDDGQGADDIAGDGLYSVEFIPEAEGVYDIAAQISGELPNGSVYALQAGAQLTTVEPTAIFTGIAKDQGVDVDGNGLFDLLQVSPEVEIEVTGLYTIYVVLEASNGRTLSQSVSETLTSGTQFVDVGFPSDEIQLLRVDGPYDIVSVEALFVGSDGVVPADRAVDLGQTQGYRLDQFDRSGILFTGLASDTATDTDGNGLFDELTISVEVNLLAGGFYQWSGRLVTQSGYEIDIASNSGSLSRGTTTLSLTFDGALIGAAAADGPYVLTDFVVFGGGSNEIEDDVAETAPYGFDEFEGAPQRTTCSAAAPIVFSDFDADLSDGSVSARGEFAELANYGNGGVAVDLSTCTFVVFDPFEEVVTYSAPMQGILVDGVSYSLATLVPVDFRGQNIPPNSLDDGPGVFALVAGVATEGQNISTVIANANVVAAVVYLNDDNVFGSIRGGGENNEEELASALAQLYQSVSVEEDSGLNLPVTIAPNPISGVGFISFELAEATTVQITMHDVLGREIAVIGEGPYSAGRHRIPLVATSFAPGIYAVQIIANNKTNNFIITVAK